MGKLVYFALCFLFAFMVVGQLPAAADVHNLQSHGEEIEASERNNGVTTQKKFGRNDVLWATAKFRKILQEPDLPDGQYYCEGETITCDQDPDSVPECGGPSVCVCIRAIELCVDSRFYSP